MYTKGGCTLCDVVKAGFKDLKGTGEVAFTFESVDITDAGNEELYEKYKYDIPVVTGNGSYWFKHRFPKDVDWESEMKKKAEEGEEGKFDSIGSEPDAGRMERKRECKECGN
ncbi:hypothetical protein TrCOL_g4790 [Triparma columacea]|uniref:Glutaredoxin-like protein n=1 Tax=Triparma columacea TaxID=722753 RepID=A0A9W7GBQ5_9STRA|nr:hypothetical protein TrCOL_g4790 [Triparma columacea]